jgi:phage-related holin
MKNDIYGTVTKSFSVMWVFMVNSLAEILIWLLVMFSVVVCDLIAGSRRCLLMGEKWGFSTAWRRTFGKMVTYFSFVLMVVFIERAVDGNYGIDKWSILFICFLEGCSILSNIMKPKGYNVNITAFISLFAKKIFNIDKEDSKELIIKDKEEKK